MPHQGVSNKGIPQSRNLSNSTSQPHPSRIPNIRPTKHQTNHNHNHNNNNKNEINNKMNKFRQYVNSFFVDREVITKENTTPGVEQSIPTEPATTTTTTSTQKQQTITITNSNETTTVHPPGYARKTSLKKNLQRKQKRKIKERILVMDKLNDIACIEIQREVEDQIQAQQVNTGNRTTTNEQTSTATVDAYKEDESSEAEVQQLLYDHQCFEDDIQEAMQEDKDQHDDSNSDRDTDTEMPILVAQYHHDASSDDDTSDGSYVDGVHE